MERKDVSFTAFIQGQLGKYRPLLDIRTFAWVSLRHSRTVVMPVVVRKKELKSWSKVDTDTMPARLARKFIWREGIAEGEGR